MTGIALPMRAMEAEGGAEYSGGGFGCLHARAAIAISSVKTPKRFK